MRQTFLINSKLRGILLNCFKIFCTRCVKFEYKTVFIGIFNIVNYMVC
jgi:hypothetical protein